MVNPFIPTAYASGETAATEGNELHTETGQAAAAAGHGGGGLSIDPSVVATQMLNFVILLVILKFLLYKPLLKIMQDREKRISDGLENADKADRMLAESEQTRLETIKSAKVESRGILDNARKFAEEARTNMLREAEDEAAKIVQNGRNVLDLERNKAAQELKVQTVDMIIQTAEKVLREKIDPLRDQKLIEESLKKYSL